MGGDRAEDEDASAGRLGRGVSLVATPRRWIATTAMLGGALVAGASAVIGFAHLHRTLSSLASFIALATAAGSILLVAVLRAEESRLTRELRTARTGSPAMREQLVRRREQAPLALRLLSIQLGIAAVLLADGDRPAALDALARGSLLTRGGRLDDLRVVVEADLDRATGTAEGRAACVSRLRDRPPTGHREADLYRIHVLVKAILEGGDASAGLDLAAQLGTSSDGDLRIYAVWLRVWFDLDGPGTDAEVDESWPPLAEPEIRLAILAARAHGADELVAKL
ncbi:MAG: hypothetical protein ACREJ3_15815, partial [Polyangiaceae bacterium]